MAANRWAIHLLLAAGLPTLPACLVVTGSDQSSQTPPAPPSGQPGSQFAELPHAPGERVALRERPPGPATTTTTTVESQPAGPASQAQAEASITSDPGPKPLPDKLA